MGWLGSGAALGIQCLVKNSGHYNISKGEAAYGIKVMSWETPFGVVHFKTHPLFSFEATNRNVAVIHEPRNMKIRTITDTTFEGENPDGRGYTKIDGTKEQWLTELGYEYHHPNGWDHIAPGQKIPNGESSMWGDYHLRELALLIWRETNGETYPTFFGCCP